MNTRPTGDIDLLGPPGLDAQRLRTILLEILKVEDEPDGIDFDGAILFESIQRTLARLGTKVDELPLEGLSDEFAAHTLNADRWRTFVSRGKLDVDDDLPALVAAIRRIVDPVLDAMVGGRSFDHRWPPGGPWHE